MTSDFTKFVQLQDVIEAQTPTVDGWICPDCAHYESGYECGNGIFISVVGANMRGCPGYLEKLHKPEERKQWKANIRDQKT